MKKDPKRIVVLGPESTGKTTLVAELAAHYRTAFAPEYLRTLVANRLRDSGRMHVGMRDTRAIVLGQVANEDHAVRRAGEVVIFDTNPLQSLVYYEHYFSARRPLWLERILAQRHYDLYLLLEVDVPWVADAQRDRPRFRRGFYRLFHQALRGRQLPFVRIHGTWEERRQQAIGAIDRLRSASA
jgi:HTH-type transcriptional repressor of NAD biosynthesis genes